MESRPILKKDEALRRGLRRICARPQAFGLFCWYFGKSFVLDKFCVLGFIVAGWGENSIREFCA